MRDRAELRARSAAVETDRAGAVDEPELREEPEMDHVPDRGHVLDPEVAVAEDLQEGRLVGRVAVRDRARRQVAVEGARADVEERHAERQRSAGVAQRVARDVLAAVGIGARELVRAEKARGKPFADEAETELAGRTALRVLRVKKAGAAREGVGFVHGAVARLPFGRDGGVVRLARLGSCSLRGGVGRRGRCGSGQRRAPGSPARCAPAPELVESDPPTVAEPPA